MTDKTDQLRKVYTEGLTKIVEGNPGLYPWYPGTSVETVVERMISRIEKDGMGAVTISNSPGIIYAAKHLGIKNTYREWNAWLRA